MFSGCGGPPADLENDSANLRFCYRRRGVGVCAKAPRQTVSSDQRYCLPLRRMRATPVPVHPSTAYRLFSRHPRRHHSVGYGFIAFRSLFAWSPISCSNNGQLSVGRWFLAHRLIELAARSCSVPTQTQGQPVGGQAVNEYPYLA